MSVQRLPVLLTLSVRIMLVLSTILSAADRGSSPLYLDATQPMEKRVEDLLDSMTLEETMSYTTFAYSNLHITPSRISTTGQVQVSMDIKNTGDRPGSDVVQLYLDDVISSVTTPVKELKGFEKVTLDPGEEQTVRFNLTPEHLSLLDEQLKPVVEPGVFEVMIGSSSEDIRLNDQFEVTKRIP